MGIEVPATEKGRTPSGVISDMQARL